MIIEKIAPTFTVAAPRIVSRSQTRRFTPVSCHLSIEDIPTHSTNEHIFQKKCFKRYKIMSKKLNQIQKLEEVRSKFTSSPIANIDVSTPFHNWKRNVDSPQNAIAVQRRHNLL
jgi:hypothetical protein